MVKNQSVMAVIIFAYVVVLVGKLSENVAMAHLRGTEAPEGFAPERMDFAHEFRLIQHPYQELFYDLFPRPIAPNNKRISPF